MRWQDDDLPRIEASRVSTADGVAVFVEPLAPIPCCACIAVSLRHSGPSMSIRYAKDLETLQRHFAKTEIAYFHLLTMLALPLAGRTSFEPTIGRLEALDRFAFRSSLRRWAWMVGMRLMGPRAA